MKNDHEEFINQAFEQFSNAHPNPDADEIYTRLAFICGADAAMRWANQQLIEFGQRNLKKE